MPFDSILTPVVQTLERSRTGRTALRSWRRFRADLDPMKPRVLCVGYVKTGTSSFGKAMRHLGFSHYGYDPDMKKALEQGDVQTCLRWATSFNSLDDRPWSDPVFIDHYRMHFPGSYYVLLERDETQWLSSFFNFYGSICTKEQALQRLRDHQTEVLNILHSEPHILKMNICAGDGYEMLCPFLGLPIPETPFPWVIPRK